MSLDNDEEYKKLKPHHQKFISLLLSGKNATDAYTQSFPNASRKTAANKGYELKKKFANILERSAPINPDKIEKVAKETLNNLTLMAFADIGDMVDGDGRPKSLHKMPKPLRMAVTEVEVDGEKIRYKIGGKTKALEILSKIVRLHNEEPQINISLITEEEKESKLKEIVVRALARDADKTEEGS